MKTVFALLLLTFADPAHAREASISLSDLRPGDLLLQSQPCFLCALIEIEEGLPYSHVGIAVQEGDGSWSALEAWNRVAQVPLGDFLKRRRKDTETLVLRPRYVPSLGMNPAALNRVLIARFNTQFAGHSYDNEFLWNNGDGNGESYYCSELVAKLINPALMTPLLPKAMHFNQNRQYWIKYFGGTPPDGKPGMSPPDIVRNPHLSVIGKI